MYTMLSALTADASQPLPPEERGFRGVLVEADEHRTVQQVPVKYTIILVPIALENLGEQLPKKIIVRGLLKAQFPNVVEVDPELLREALAQLLDWSGLLLLANLLILLLVRGGLETLPRKAAS